MDLVKKRNWSMKPEAKGMRARFSGTGEERDWMSGLLSRQRPHERKNGKNKTAEKKGERKSEGGRPSCLWEEGGVPIKVLRKMLMSAQV